MKETRIDRINDMETKIEDLIKDLDIYCPDNKYYQMQKEKYAKLKIVYTVDVELGIYKDLTTLLNRHESCLAVLKMLHSKFKFG